MWSQVGAFVAGAGPWLAMAGFGLVLAWSVVVVRELVRSGRPFTVRLGKFSVTAGQHDRSDEA